jgi:cytochrome b subunit of formate dehydrogenase
MKTMYVAIVSGLVLWLPLLLSPATIPAIQISGQVSA